MKFLRFFICLIMLLTLLYICICCASIFENYNYYIFEDISECETIENSTLPGAKFEKYASAEEEDKNLKALTYTEYFCGVFSCDDFEFEIFAYEFVDAAIAKQYFVNATGVKNPSDVSCHKYDGLLNVRFSVLDMKNVYFVKVKKMDFDETYSFLREIFSKQI